MLPPRCRLLRGQGFVVGLRIFTPQHGGFFRSGQGAAHINTLCPLTFENRHPCIAQSTQNRYSILDLKHIGQKGFFTIISRAIGSRRFNLDDQPTAIIMTALQFVTDKAQRIAALRQYSRSAPQGFNGVEINHSSVPALCR